MVTGTNKLDALTRILEVEEFDGIIIFVRTKTSSVELADRLEARGHSAAAINGDMTQKLREATIAKLKNNRLDILVATDVAARGIDVARISHVINYDIPYDTEAYVHRIGRTGRAGRAGTAILFVAPRERRLLGAIEKATRQKMTELHLPSKEQIHKKRSGQFKAKISETLAKGNLAYFEQLIADYIAESGTEPLQLAAALAFMAQKDQPLVATEGGHKELSNERTKRPSKDGHREHPEALAGLKVREFKEPKHHREEQRTDRREHASLKGIVMETYRIAVGRTHQVKPGDIVGAIANEADIDSEYIGRIQIFDDYSTVDLPEGMPKELCLHLKKVRVRNQPLGLEKLSSGQSVQKKARTKPSGKAKKSRGKSRPKKK